VKEQVELLAAQIQGLAVDGGHPAAGVDGESTDSDRRVGVVTVDSTEHGPDAGVELVGRVRLDHVLVGTGVERANDVPFVVAGRGHDHRDGAHGAQHAKQLESVDVGQAEVEDDYVRSLLHDLAQGAEPGRRPQHDVAPFGQPSRDGGADVGVVLHHGNGGHALDATARWHASRRVARRDRPRSGRRMAAIRRGGTKSYLGLARS
jgi:hypothetical protein